MRCDFAEGLIEEERNTVRTLRARDLSHRYERRITAMDGISFQVRRGEMVCILGPSGCGKSTLLKALGGQLRPDQGRIDINGLSLYGDNENLASYLAFIPQDETFDPLLTVEENLDTAAAIRAPQIGSHERGRRVDSKMVELGLSEIRHRPAGDSQTKSLSGGQRRRLNAGMDMIGNADVFLFDEPTSGLSSKDSEHVLETIRSLTHNKITLVSIHQPSRRLFQLFDKAILLDNGGRLAFFGTPAQTLDYFNTASLQEGLNLGHVLSESPDQPASEQLTPDFIFDVLEFPLRDLNGDIIFEEDNRGRLVPCRRFTPQFWAERFQTHRLFEDVSLRNLEGDTTYTGSLTATPEATPNRLRHDWTRFSNQFKRAFLSKLRNRANLGTTLLEAPALAFLVAIVLRYSEDGDYHFNNAYHIPTYLFLTLVIAMFLGLTNSAEEIIKDKNVLLRERHHGFRISGYIFAKYIALGFFALIQCSIYLLIGNAILGVQALFFQTLLWMFLTSFIGIVSGLFISSIVNSPKTAVNIIPLVMIPNIILGGALIKYDEMNKGLNLVGNIQLWFSSEARKADQMSSSMKVPPICNLMPLRWSYESLIIEYAENNPVRSLVRDVEKKIDYYRAIPLTQKFTDEEKENFRQLKDALAVVNGLKGSAASDIREQLRDIHRSLEARTFRAADFRQPSEGEGEARKASSFFLNQKVDDLFDRAEVERQDYRRKETPPNVFFGSERSFRVFGSSFTIETLRLNLIGMGAFCLAGFLVLRKSLKRTLRKV